MSNTDLTTTESQSERRIASLDELQRMAEAMGPLFSKSPRDMLALMLLSQAEGKHPAIAAQEYDIIQGRPAINSKSAQARFQMAGGMIKWVTRTDKIVTVEFSHPQSGSLSITWDIDRATKAGLMSKDNWKKYPAQMLAARCIAEGVRACFPACLSGLYTVEEVQDFPEMRNVTVSQPADADGKAKRKEVLDYIKSVSDQIPEANKKDIRAWIDSSKYDIDELTALKERVEQLVSTEPELPVNPPSSDPEIDDIASEAFEDDKKQLEIF